MRTSSLPFLLGAVACAVLHPTLHAQVVPELRIELGASVTLELVEVPAGTFRQGSPESEPGRGADETAREVSLTRTFYMGKYPVTRGQWAQFAREMRYRSEAEVGTSGGFGVVDGKLVQRRDFTWRNPGFAQTDQDPVTIVTYKDALAFLAWLSRKSGRAFALPTEAQWEYACRAGTATSYPNGDGLAAADAIAWHRGDAAGTTHPVGGKSANAWGIYDMPGNVWEWCQDWYGPYPPGQATDPVQTSATLSDKPRRVLRGGSFLREAASCRAATRYRNDPASRNADNGFRVVTFDAERPSIPLERPSPRSDALKPPVSAAAPPHVADHSAPVVQRSPRPNWMGWGIVLMALYLGFRLLRSILGAIGRSAGGGIGAGMLAGVAMGALSRQGPFRTRIVADGFWVEGDGVPLGATIDCRYRIGGLEQETSFTWEAFPGGKFTFTGSKPESVSVTIRPGTAGGIADAAADWDDRADAQRERRSRRDPPAY